MLALARRILAARWSLARLALAAFVLWVVATDTPRRLAALELRALPMFDFASEVAALRAQGRFGEALMVADTALNADADDPLSPAARTAVENERDLTRAEQSSWLRRAKDAGLGALSGTGDSLEALIGAVATDFFIVGDIRDLVIQGSKLAVDGEADPVILSLSGIGLATTLAPEIDWAPSILKAARKAGTLSRRFADNLVTIIKSGKKERAIAVMGDVASLSKRASPGGAMRLMRHADDADDLAALARFAERQPGAAFALHLGGPNAARLAKTAANAADLSADAEKLFVKASRRGVAGQSLVNSRTGRALLRPHALVGVTKALWKGNAAKLVERALDRLAPDAWWLLPALGTWVFIELALLSRRLAPRRAHAPPAAEELRHAA